MTERIAKALEQCSSNQLGTLLALAQNKTGKGDQPEIYGINEDRLTELLDALCTEKPNAGKTLLSAFEDTDIPLPVLRELKNVAKRLQARAATDEQKAAANILYHAAVAAAYAGYGINTSTRSAHSRLELYQVMAERLSSPMLAQVFGRAVKRLRGGD